jgi:ABC-type dipeptide/oligopeptide/nickel transport system permease subunit
VLATLVNITIGTVFGLAAGYLGGAVAANLVIDILYAVVDSRVRLY